MEIDGVHRDDCGHAMVEAVVSKLHILGNREIALAGLKINGAIEIENFIFTHAWWLWSAGPVLRHANAAFCPGRLSVMVGPVTGCAGGKWGYLEKSLEPGSRFANQVLLRGC